MFFIDCFPELSTVYKHDYDAFLGNYSKTGDNWSVVDRSSSVENLQSDL